MARTISSYHTRGTLVRVDRLDVPGVQTIAGIQSGSNTEIDITNLGSQTKEYKLGLSDSGVLPIDGIAAPQHPTSIFLEAARFSGEELLLEVYFGGVPDDENYTNGSAQTIKRNVRGSFSYTAATGGADASFTFTAEALLVPSVSEGDYIVSSNGQYKILSIARSGANNVYTAEGTGADTDTEADFVQPSILFSARARVPKFETSGSTDDVARYSAEFRPTGKWVRTIGAPSLTIRT